MMKARCLPGHPAQPLEDKERCSRFSRASFGRLWGFPYIQGPGLRAVGGQEEAGVQLEGRACSPAVNCSPAALKLHDLGHVRPALGASSLCDQVSWEDSRVRGHLFRVIWTPWNSS